MSLQRTQERRIRFYLYALILSICVIYVGQIAVYKYRLHAVGAVFTPVSKMNEECGEKNCTGTFELTPSAKYLLLGHVMRYHNLYRSLDGKEIYPISAVRGVANESWLGLRIYSVESGQSYRLVATKPKAVKMGYFVGILPRSTDHEGILSVPDISPTISSITTMAGFGVLGVLLFAAFLAPQAGADARRSRDELVAISVSSIAGVFIAAIASGMVDSLMPDGELRSRILRTAVLIALTTLPGQAVFKRLRFSSNVSIILSVTLVVLSTNIFWPYLRAGVVWISSLMALTVALSLWLAKGGRRLAAFSVLLGIYDPLVQASIVAISDVPPIYFLNVMATASWSLVAADLGGVSVVALASRAYHRFTRDIALAQIDSVLNSKTSSEDFELSSVVKDILPKIANLTGAGRVSILVNLPYGRPIIHIYNANDKTMTTHDDGRIPGAVTVRAFVYGDEAWFEKYSDFSARLSIPHSRHLKAAEYVCVAPIKVSHNNAGVLMLTCFDDDFVEMQIRTGRIFDDRETGKFLLDTLSASFSNALLGDMAINRERSSEILSQVREAIPISASKEEFLQRFCDAATQATGLRSMLHQWVGEKGLGIAQAGFEIDHWRYFLNSPFNLADSAERAYGSTVVAFKENKSSYLKDWVEIQDKLHPKTVQILSRIGAKSFLAVPLRSGETSYVLTLISNVGEPPKDPGLMKIIESTEAIFDAAVTVLNQRTSVLALGKLANRLIGDDDVRDKIIAAAKEEHLPTIIGTPRTSFLLLFDLVGSSHLPKDTEEKARSYGQFYDEVNIMVNFSLGGKIRKTIGDAVIVTWDGTNVSPEDNPGLLNSLVDVVRQADAVAVNVGCKGVRAVLHYGDYFFGLVGTSSFGQIDVIGSGIDEVCKMEGFMKQLIVDGRSPKISVSTTASKRLPLIGEAKWIASGFQSIANNEGGPGRWQEIDRVCTDMVGLSTKFQLGSNKAS